MAGNWRDKWDIEGLIVALIIGAIAGWLAGDGGQGWRFRTDRRYRRRHHRRYRCQLAVPDARRCRLAAAGSARSSPRRSVQSSSWSSSSSSGERERLAISGRNPYGSGLAFSGVCRGVSDAVRSGGDRVHREDPGLLSGRYVRLLDRAEPRALRPLCGGVPRAAPRRHHDRRLHHPRSRAGAHDPGAPLSLSAARASGRGRPLSSWRRIRAWRTREP